MNANERCTAHFLSMLAPVVPMLLVNFYFSQPIWTVCLLFFTTGLHVIARNTIVSPGPMKLFIFDGLPPAYNLHE